MDFTVHNYGSDAYGRDVLMTAFMHDWWEARVAELGFRPEIQQGAFMSRIGGGAAASSGAHDLGGCLDVQTEGFSTAKVDRMVHVFRANGAAAWRRDETARHGSMPKHCHLTLGADRPLSDMAQISWNSYVSGGDGLAGPYNDYEWRPDPIVTTPPQEDDMDAKELIAALNSDAGQAALSNAVRKTLLTDVPQPGGKVANEYVGSLLKRLIAAVTK